MEDQMPVKFIVWKEMLFQHIQNDGHYSPTVATVMRDEDPDDEVERELNPPLELNPA
jgi:hypothetical protein